MPKVILVRHGAFAPEGPPRYWGHTDLPLSPAGIEQAERLRDRLAREPIDLVFTSDLARCAQTATIVAAPHGLVPLLRPNLREIRFGGCEGLSFAEIASRFPQAERFWAPDAVDVPFPGGESVAMLAERVRAFLAEASRLDAGAVALVVSHGGPVKALVCLALGLDPARWWQLRIDLGSLSVLDLYAEGAVLSGLNDVSHLR